LLSKKLVTIDCNVSIELNIEQMHAGEPDIETLRTLFTELEFTSLLKELLPVVEAQPGNYRETDSVADVQSLLGSRRPDVPIAIAIDSALQLADNEEEAEQSEEGRLPLALTEVVSAGTRTTQIAVSIDQGSALSVSAGSPAEIELRATLGDSAVPKAIHDWKTAAHVLGESVLAGVEHDTRLYSYLVDPTYSSHALAEVALRRFNLNLEGSLAEAADMTGRLAATLRKEVEDGNLLKLYEEIDLPLVPVLTRMEQAGVAIDRVALDQMSERLEVEIDAKAREIYDCCGSEFNINSPKQLGEVLFNKLNLPKPVKYGKGKTISTAVDVLEEL